MVPDKIYAKIIAGSLCVSRTPNEIFGEQYPEYIRKDALLDKLSRAKELRLRSGAKESSDGIRVIDALIKMIKEM